MNREIVRGSASAENERGTYASYASGFVLSVIFTLCAYFAVTQHLFSGWALVIALLALAIVQFFVQLFFFLHVGRESKPRWKRLVLMLMITIVLVLVIGSIWIMYNLNYRMAQKTPQQINTYLKDQGGGF